MSSKQSCFKSIVKCDLRRSWWISALAALFIFMSSTSPLFNYRYDFYSYSRYDNAIDFCEMMFGNYVIGMCVAAFVVLYLFSYINKVNSVSFFHSLPATRNTLLFAHITSSAVLIVSPMLINSLISFLAIGKGVKASWILLSFCMYLLYSFVIFGLTLVVSMLTGVSIASGIFTAVVVLLPLFVFSFVSELCSDYLYGYAGFKPFEDYLLEYIYLAPEMLTTAKVIIYIVLAAALIGISFLIYNKRHLENFGEVIAFPKLKGTFKVLFGLCSGVIGYYYFEAFWNISSILTMLVFGTLGVVIAHMLANKGFSLRGVFKPLVATTVLILALFVVFFFDIFGYEKRIPDIDDIEYADIGGLYYEEYSYVDSDVYGDGRIRVQKKDPFIPHFRSQEEIALFLDLHKYAVDHQSENDMWNDDIITPSYRITDRRHFSIEYTLKNGSVMKRDYYLPTAEMEAFTTRIYNTDTYRKWKYPVLDGVEKTYKSVGIYDRRTYYDDEYIRLSAKTENAMKLIEAVKKDRENISFDRMRSNDYGNLVTVELNYTLTYVSEEGKEYQIEHSDSYSIGKYDVNTWALLEELNLFGNSRMITIDDVKSVDVYADEYFINEVVEIPERIGEQSAYFVMETTSFVSDYDYKYNNGYNKNFNEKEDIEILFDLYMNHHNDVSVKGDDYVVVRITLNLKDSTTRSSRELIIPVKSLPENLKFIEEFFVER